MTKEERAIYNKQYAIDNKVKLKEKRDGKKEEKRQYNKDHKVEIAKQVKLYHQDNKFASE